MAWKEKSVMTLKVEFIEAYSQQDKKFSQLCDEFSISRKTGYKWVKRFDKFGNEGLIDKRTLRNVRDVVYNKDIWENIFSLKQQFPTWGPRKLLQYFVNQSPEYNWPSESLTKKRFKKEGLSKRKTGRPSFFSERLPLHNISGCNDVWGIDFKGWIMTKDQKRCEPLTIIDTYSRYLLLCTPVKYTGFANIVGYLEDVFFEYGKPLALRSDNGSPFGSKGTRGLSKMSVYLLKHGIWPDKIRPGHPKENGRLERLHRTISEDVLKREHCSYAEYIVKLNKFCSIYNTVRPHESHNGAVPASIYIKSARQFNRYEEIEYKYPEGFNLYEISNKGYLYIDKKRIYISESLSKEIVGVGAKTEFGRELIFLGYPLGMVENYKTYAPQSV